MKLKKNEILVLKTVDSNGLAYNYFQYPLEIGAVVTAPDWEPTNRCGNGLHGLPWGMGDTEYLSTDSDALWMLLKVDTTKDYLYGEEQLIDKCKFKTGIVAFVGSKEEALEILHRTMPTNTSSCFMCQVGKDKVVQFAGIWSTQTAGNWSTQTAGDRSTQTAGYRSTQAAGDRSTQAAGDRSTQTAGNRSMQTTGDGSTQTAGNWSFQTAGDWSTQTVRNWSTQTAGDWSTQTAGYESTQTAGNYSTQTAGNDSTQTAGVDTIQVCFYCKDGKRFVATRKVTEAEAGKPYLFKDGVWTEIETQSGT